MMRFHCCISIGIALATQVYAGIKTGQLIGMESSSSGVQGIYEINIDTGLAWPIAYFPVNPSEGALAVSPDGTLYAAFSADIDQLVIVDPLNGDLTYVGSFGSAFQDVSGLAFSPDGTLYGYDDSGCELLTIDVNTGVGLLVGTVGFFKGGGLTFSPDGILYAVGSVQFGNPTLWIIDPQTGATQEVGPFGAGHHGTSIDSSNSLEFVDGQLFASAEEEIDGVGSLYEIDPATGNATWIGYFSGDGDIDESMAGMAYLPGAGDVDRDGDVDITDYDIFVSCFTGSLDPGGEPLPVECVFLDSDDDNDIDCLDWEAFIVNWTEDEEPPTLEECDLPPPGCEGDANGDNVVDPLDAGFVQARFGCPVNTGDPECDAADASADGAVDPLDVGFVLARFGVCP